MKQSSPPNNTKPANYGAQSYSTGNDQGEPGWLVLIRHGESQWNALGKWTGHTDVRLSEAGHNQARQMGALIKDIELHHSFTSDQIRTIETLAGVLDGAGHEQLPRSQSRHLKERDYGDYTGLNKWEVLEQVGEETFNNIRRSWDHPIPNGETLAMVSQRAVPYYHRHILPRLLAGQNVVVVSHGNTLRALIKHIEGISDSQVAEVEMPLGQVVLYRVSPEGTKLHKEMRQIKVTKSKA